MSYPRFAWILLANQHHRKQGQIIERPSEKLADIRRTRDASLLTVLLIADVTLVYLILYPVFARSGSWWDALIALAALLVIVKQLSRLFVTLFRSTSSFRLIYWLSIVDRLPSGLLFLLYVYALSAGLMLSEWAQKIREE
jgi:hypothetical protein